MSNGTRSPRKRAAESNPHLAKRQSDLLFHLGLNTAELDFKKEFGDTRFVLIGGSNSRMEVYAKYVGQKMGYTLPQGLKLANIAEKGDRFAMFKVGPVLTVSHGMGVGSVAILLNELIKLLWHADCTDVTLFRLGTSGGVGVRPGTVVVTEEPLDDLLRPVYEQHILGEVVFKPASLDKELVSELLALQNDTDDFEVVAGKTIMGTDFYECQARTDGAVCGYTEEDKMQFLRKVYEKGVRNFEMEAAVIGGLTNAVGLRAAIVCVTLLNRLEGDQMVGSHTDIQKWETRPIDLVTRLIMKKLKNEGYRDERFKSFSGREREKTN